MSETIEQVSTKRRMPDTLAKAARYKRYALGKDSAETGLCGTLPVPPCLRLGAYPEPAGRPGLTKGAE